MTGDGEPDLLVLSDLGGSTYRLAVGSSAEATITMTSYLLSVASAEVDGDGVNDLVVGSLWEDRVFVFLGPLAGTLQSATADVVVVGPASGGLALLMGSAVVIVDANADGSPDVIVTAPGEGEETCFATEPPRLYRGPFVSGQTLTDDDVDILLGGPGAFSCLGEAARCLAQGFELSAHPSPVCYPVPVGSGEPVACE